MGPPKPKRSLKSKQFRAGGERKLDSLLLRANPLISLALKPFKVNCPAGAGL